MTHESDKELRKPRKIDMGIVAYINPQECSSIENHYSLWRKKYDEIKHLTSIEIQYEIDYRLNYWQSIPDIFKDYTGRLCLHGPIQGRDLATADTDLREKSINEYYRVIDLSNRLNSSGVIIHLTPQDDFYDRNSQRDRGVHSFRQIAEYCKQNGNTRLILENLEYPKWPSDKNETISMLEEFKDLYANIGFCVDVAHLWHNHSALLPSHQLSDDRFPEVLGEYIRTLSQIIRIDRFHFGGAYIDYSKNSHETHGIPGHYPEGSALTDTTLYFDSVPNGFSGRWMPVSDSLEVIFKYISESQSKGIDKPDIIFEVHRKFNDQVFLLNYLSSRTG